MVFWKKQYLSKELEQGTGAIGHQTKNNCKFDSDDPQETGMSMVLSKWIINPI